MEYIYEEYQAFFTFFIPYLSFENWNFGIGLNWGIARYNFDLLEEDKRVSHVVGQYRPLNGARLLFEYRVGGGLNKGLFQRTYIFIDANNGELTSNHPLRVDLSRSNGLPADPLYATWSVLRIGIRKEIDLIEDERPDIDCKCGDQGIKNTGKKTLEKS